VVTLEYLDTAATQDQREILVELAHPVTAAIPVLHRPAGILDILVSVAILAILESVDIPDILGQGSAVILVIQELPGTLVILD